MKILAFRLTIAIFAFLFGMGAVALLILNRSLPVIEVQKAKECASESDESIISSRSALSTKLLETFQEFPLDKTNPTVDEGYRLTWFPTFDAPTVVRISRSGDEFSITTKWLSGLGGYDLGKLKHENTRPLSGSAWKEFTELVDNRCFWNAASVVDEVPVVDGATWILEASKDGRYHFVDRISPSDQMADLFRKLLDFSDNRIGYEDYLPQH